MQNYKSQIEIVSQMAYDFYTPEKHEAFGSIIEAFMPTFNLSKLLREYVSITYFEQDMSPYLADADVQYFHDALDGLEFPTAIAWIERNVLSNAGQILSQMLTESSITDSQKGFISFAYDITRALRYINLNHPELMEAMGVNDDRMALIGEVAFQATLASLSFEDTKENRQSRYERLLTNLSYLDVK